MATIGNKHNYVWSIANKCNLIWGSRRNFKLAYQGHGGCRCLFWSDWREPCAHFRSCARSDQTRETRPPAHKGLRPRENERKDICNRSPLAFAKNPHSQMVNLLLFIIRSFPKNEWMSILTCVQGPIYPDLQMKMSLLMSLPSFQGSRSGHF